MERVHFLRKPTGLIITRVNHKDFKDKKGAKVGRFNWSTGQIVTAANWIKGNIKRDQPTTGISTYPTIRRYLEAIRTVCVNHLSCNVDANRLRHELVKLTKRHVQQP